MNRSPENIIATMKPWWETRQTKNVRGRTPNQCGWDSGILAAAEYVRRRTGNEELAGEIHALLTTKLPEPK